MKAYFVRLLVCLACVNGALAATTVIYSNPVMPGDFPDPSVVRVGTNYWATATSSEWGPLFPILRSSDLVNWELTGHVFPTQKPEWSSMNYWAPEITHYNGKFYVYYVGRKNVKDGVLNLAVATAEKATGPWTDHGPLIGQDEGSIDAATFATKDGLYMFWKNDGNSRGLPTFIHAQKLSDDGTKLVGEMKQLFRNDAPWEGNLIEGPYVMKHDDYFYIFYAGNGCCGKRCSYGVGVARSKNILGPYEKCPGNPIIGQNDQWKCPGHGSIVSTSDGRDYFLYHAYATKGFVYTGRQGVLDEVKWNADGWPTINEGKGVSVSAPSPHGKAQRHEAQFIDDFTAENLSPRWQWPHSLEPMTKIENGQLILNNSSERADDLFASVVAIQATAADYVATTLIDLKDIKPGVQAGLFAFGDRQNALGITLNNEKVSVFRRLKNKTETLGSVDTPKLEMTYLRVEAREGHLFHFYVWSGRKWTEVGNGMALEGDFLPPWDRGVRIALTAGGNENGAAKFEWLRYVPVQP